MQNASFLVLKDLRHLCIPLVVLLREIKQFSCDTLLLLDNYKIQKTLNLFLTVLNRTILMALKAFYFM